MLTQIKIYWTAKREHANKILKAIPDGFHCNSRWVYMQQFGDRPVTHWLRENFDDAIASNFVGFLVEPGDKLKTSLIEIGNALAHGKKIFIASDTLIDVDDPTLMPHKDLMPWVGFGEQIKYTGTQKQTYKFIRKMVDDQRITKHDGHMEDRK